ncbi:hypothetical protein IP92_02222 [Pseudoduganella flava]|uniref:Uncharacterized protein n=1 Tax=Pseudoduganella flava TaxID=871742 RepID=A0A562PWP5_9BURK|nr:hypothetical protein [Pseudoduganella flava]QGZ39896.1 hypothetical protein GO485_13105 [Pseudoduganella flava]TWI48829.1 hypothetical protein IP92_02222 [Pseudoduganella flava]
MSYLSTTLRLVAAVSFLCVLSGCASLQIDVDVYKGPLVNNEDIQSQQVISMALSAKPLMMSARNSLLEKAFKDDAHLTELRTCFGKQIKRSYLAGITLQDTALEKRKRLAMQVNDLLSFYLNRDATLAVAPLTCEEVKLDNNAGFTAGRFEKGIDELANAVSTEAVAQKSRSSGPSPAPSDARVTLESALTDLAARMLFLSTNQWLIEDDDEDSPRYRALFEAVANSILLHIDDLQNRRKFDKDVQVAGTTEESERNKSRSLANQTQKVQPAIDVIDAEITQLRYEHIKAIRLYGKDGPESKRIAQALTEARNQRSLMIYLRPSSAYLRSVFAATYTQQDPGLGWQNMLNDQILDMFHIGQDPKDVRQLRAGLDKAFWQNINTVRVSAAGSSNFVVAKDDVGNWYVKSMGSDPAAMVNAAKNLALYNMGGKFDTNLLRVAELRNRKDDTNLSDTERNRASAELTSLTRGQTGPAVAAHGQTWTLFDEHYRQQGDSQLKEVAGHVQSNAFAQQLRARWAATMKDAPSDAQRNAVDGTLTHTQVTSAFAAVQNAVVPATGQAGGDALVNALEALGRYRDAIDTQLLAADVLVATETAAATQAERDRSNAEQVLDASLKQLTVAEGTLRVAETAAEQGNTALLPGAKANYQQARARVETDTAAAALARKNAIAATDALSAATRRREAARGDVDIVVGEYVRTAAGRRMRSIEEMETAIKVIGQSIQQ